MKALVLLATGLLIYALLGMLVGWGAVSQPLGTTSWWLWPLGATVIAAGYGLLFARWQLLLKGLNRPLPAAPSAAIYLAGLGLIAAPARSGEALRGLWLHRRHQIPLRIGVAATVAERLLDLTSAMLVLAWGLGRSKQHGTLLVVLLAMVLLAWLISHPTPQTSLERAILRLPLSKPWRGIRRVLWEGVQSLSELRTLLRPGPLILGLILTSAVWLLESSLLQLVLQQLGASLTLGHTSVVRTATSLGGVISLLPAGLGTSEVTSVGLAMLYGASKGQALAATVVMRALTLLLPTVIGLAALALQPDLQTLRRSSQ